ncbi:MAG: DUF2608 domain-containing protein [Chlamydiae bacterium]|nr:DUF2608 domain-containing protein [Chlamydiota bacterium]
MFGYLLTINQDKGTVLNEFLVYSKIKPKKIVFLDDKENNLKSVEKTSKKLKIEFIWLSDNQAEKFLKK